MWVIFKFKSSNGYNARHVVWSGFPGANAWTTFSFTLNGYDGWDNHTVFDQADLTDISEFSISLMKNDGTSASGTATVLFDDMQIVSEAPEVQEGMIDSFAYANDAEATTAWAPISTAAVTSIAAGKDGRGLQIAASSMVAWTRYGAYRTFASPVDMSAVEYFQICVKGSSSNSPGPRLYMYLKDASGQKARVVFSSCMQADRWLCYRIIASFAPAAAPAGAGDADGFYGEYQDAGDWNNAVQPFHQDKWDGGILTDVNLAQISEVQLIMETGTEGESATVQVDSLVAAPLASLDPSAVPAWEMFD
jgi:hypothetical protein